MEKNIINECIFCDKNNSLFNNDNIIYETNSWIAVYDGFGITDGHALIIPKKHLNLSDLNIIDYIKLFYFFKKVRRILNDKFNTNSFNIGINDGFEAGQTINHLHIHIIPRKENDGGLPCGVRNIFPNKANYLKIK